MPPVSAQICKAAKIEKGAGNASPVNTVGQITKAQAIEIAKKKGSEMTAASLEAAVRSVAGTARSMGVKVVD